MDIPGMAVTPMPTVPADATRKTSRKIEREPRSACGLVWRACSDFDRESESFERCWKSQSLQYLNPEGTGPPQILHVESLNALSFRFVGAVSPEWQDPYPQGTSWKPNLAVHGKDLLTIGCDFLSPVNSDHRDSTGLRFRLHNLLIAARNRAKRLAPASWE
jgi:hypothetical protein